MLSVTVSTAERIATLRLSDPEGVRQIDRVLHDVMLVGERRIDVDRCVGDEKRPRIAGRVNGKNVTDPPCGAKAPLMVHDRAHELVRMKRALHQRFGLAGARHRDGCLRPPLRCAPWKRSRRAERSMLGLLGCGADLVFGARREPGR